MRHSFIQRQTAALAAVFAAVLGLAACGGSSEDSGGGGSDPVAVSLITKDSVNPFWIAMQKGAKEQAAKDGVDLTIGAGAKDGDEAGQVTLIENAIAKGQQGILIAANGPGVNAALKKARDAGIYVLALDTPTDPADAVDGTIATDNFKAGQLDGQWAAKALGGKPAVIGLIDAFNDKVITVDYNRDQGFLDGMGIDTKDPKKNGDEAPTGSYTGGTYSIVCNEPGQGSQTQSKTAMERCLAKNPNINLVYSLNEPSGVGASDALKAAGKTAVIVSVDGGCQGVAQVKSGILAATAQQYPVKMAQLGVQAIVAFKKDGTKVQNSPGLDFLDAGVALVTDKPQDGVESITTDEGSKICWGTAS